MSAYYCSDHDQFYGSNGCCQCEDDKKDVLWQNEQKETITSPSHYTHGKYQPFDIIEDWGLDTDYYLGAVLHYLCRAKHKGSELEDCKKAREFLNRKILVMEKSDDRST